MANGLVPSPRKRNRSFFQQLAQPEEDEGFFGLGRYQPLPEFETPGQQPLIRAPRMPQPEQRIRIPGQVVVPGGGIPGVSTGTFTGEPILAPAPGVKRPEPRAPAPQRPEAPELARPGWKRGLLAIGLGTLAGMGGDSRAAARTAGNVLYGPYRRRYAGYERDLADYESRREEERQQDIGEGRRVGLELTQERLRRLRLTPMPGAEETEAEAFERRKEEAVSLGLEAGSPEYLEYVSERELGFAPRQRERYTRTLPGGESELLERRPGEDYYRPAQMLAPGVEEIAPPITLEHGGVGGQPLQLPGPRPPTEAVVSHPRPARPLAREVTAEVNSMVEGTATDALEKANGDPNRAIAIVNASENIPPEHKQKVRNRIREKVRPGARTQQGGLEEEINQALQGLTQ